ncbi:MAG: transaldolase family protein [Verrucomicrobiota bacterium]
MRTVETIDNLKAMTRLGAEWWNDSCEPDHLAEAVAKGASGATSNPVIVEAAVSSNKERWMPVVVDLSASYPNDSAEEITWRLISEMGRQAAEILEPVYKASGGTKGFLSLQVNPELAADADSMFEHAVQLAAVAPNIAIKVPSTKPGFDAAERLVARGISVNTTVSFSVAQAMAAAEAIERGLDQFEAAGNDPESIHPYVTIMVGRVGDYLNRIAEGRGGVEIDEESVILSGVWVFRQAARLFRRRQFRPTLLAAAYRHELQWSQIIGKEVLQSIPYAWWKQFQFADCDVRETVWNPVEEARLAGLRRAFPEFDALYREDGMSIDEFGVFEATEVTVEQFTGGYRSLVELVDRAMISG